MRNISKKTRKKINKILLSDHFKNIPSGMNQMKKMKRFFPKQNWRLITIFRQMKSSVERN